MGKVVPTIREWPDDLYVIDRPAEVVRFRIEVKDIAGDERGEFGFGHAGGVVFHHQNTPHQTTASSVVFQRDWPLNPGEVRPGSTHYELRLFFRYNVTYTVTVERISPNGSSLIADFDCSATGGGVFFVVPFEFFVK